MSQYGHYTITCGRYIKRRNMSGKCLFLPLKVSNFHFLTPCGPLYLPTKYRNFAQSPFKHEFHIIISDTLSIRNCLGDLTSNLCHHPPAHLSPFRVHKRRKNSSNVYYSNSGILTPSLTLFIRVGRH